MEMPLNLVCVDCGAFLCDLVEVGWDGVGCVYPQVARLWARPPAVTTKV